jgi:hypothetical protein
MKRDGVEERTVVSAVFDLRDLIPVVMSIFYTWNYSRIGERIYTDFPSPFCLASFNVHSPLHLPGNVGRVEEQASDCSSRYLCRFFRWL